jgi:hypothetical protein
MAQIALALILVFVDFAHGIALGEHNVGFHPIYRVRQSLAIAISRLHEPPATGYLAYGSVVDAFTRDGFAVLAGEGPPLDLAGWEALLSDPARMEQALQDAKNVAIDPSRPPKLLIGNEIAYVDYIYDAFRLFGMHMASLYYFYFLLLAGSLILFLIQFRKSGLCLFILTLYLAAVCFLQAYAHAGGVQLLTLANSRLFECLALLPALHIYLVVWRRTPLTAATFFMVLAQSMLLAFMVVCRITAIWLIAMIAGSAILTAAWDRWASRGAGRSWRWIGLWPGAAAVFALGAGMAIVDFGADAAYKREAKYHVVWHEILLGILDSSDTLQETYVHQPSVKSDMDCYLAIMNDLTARNDLRSPIAYEENRKILITPEKSMKEYDRLARALVLRIVRDHPLEVLRSFGQKISDQIDAYEQGDQMASKNFVGSIVIVFIGLLAWAAGARLEPPPAGAVSNGLAAAIVLLACGASMPLIEPNSLSVGALMAYLGAFVFLVVYAARLGVGVLVVCEPAPSPA